MMSSLQILRLPVELLPHVARFLPLDEKLDFADALGTACPDLRRVKGKRRLKRAVNQLVLDGDVDLVFRLCARTTPTSFRIIRPQLLRVTSDAEVFAVLCMHFEGQITSPNLDITFPRGLPTIEFSLPLTEVSWQRTVLRLISWDHAQTAWTDEHRFRLFSVFRRRGFAKEKLTGENLRDLGLNEERAELFNRWWDEYENHPRHALRANGNFCGGLLQLAAYGAQDVYIRGRPQITFFKVECRGGKTSTGGADDPSTAGVGKRGKAPQSIRAYGRNKLPPPCGDGKRRRGNGRMRWPRHWR